MTRELTLAVAPLARLIVIVVGIGCCGCGIPTAPTSESVTGDWAGVLSPGHSTYLNIRFSNVNGRFTGRACVWSMGFLLQDDIPVTARVTAGHPSGEVSLTLYSDLLVGIADRKLMTLRGQHHYSYLYRQSGYCDPARK